MTTTHGDGDAIVADYLRRLDGALQLQQVPLVHRREILDGIREHISAARAGHDDERDSDVLNLLDRLGVPEEIAAAAAGDRPEIMTGTASQARPVLEIIALLLLSVGSIVVPIVGWLAGVVLLWLSPLWTRRDKLIGTFLPPGGIGVLLLLGVSGVGTGACETLTVDGQVVQDTCAHGAQAVWQGTLTVVLLLLFLVLPIITVAYLGRRLRRANGSLATRALRHRAGSVSKVISPPDQSDKTDLRGHASLRVP